MELERPPQSRRPFASGRWCARDLDPLYNGRSGLRTPHVFDVPRESCATTTWSALSGCFFASSLSAAFESLPVRPAGIEKLVEPSVSTFFVPFFLRLAVTAPVVFSVSVPVHVPIALRRAGKRELKLSVLGDGRGLRSERHTRERRHTI